MPHGDGDADAHQFLEAVDVGDEVGVEVVCVEGVPEVGVGAALEEGVEAGEFLDGFGEGGVRLRKGCGGGGGRRGEDVGREEVEAEGEVRGGEDGEGFDEDVGDGFVAGEVRVELVAVGRERRKGGFSSAGYGFAKRGICVRCGGE